MASEMRFVCSECYNYYPTDNGKGECLAKYVDEDIVDADKPMCDLYFRSLKA